MDYIVGMWVYKGDKKCQYSAQRVTLNGQPENLAKALLKAASEKWRSKHTFPSKQTLKFMLIRYQEV